MRTFVMTTAAVVALACVPGCGDQTPNADEGADIAYMDAANGNVLLAEWTGPYGGVPAFDKMELADLKPALDAGMARSLAEIDAIAENPEPPTFENTIVAMERTGRDLDRVQTYRRIWGSNLSSPEFREIQIEMAPKLAEFSTKIIQNQALFDRIQTVYESEEAKTLRPDQQRLLLLVYDRFARNGATLSVEAKERYAAINQRLAELHTQFANNVLADEEGAACRSRWFGLRPRRRRNAAATASTPLPIRARRWIPS
jgi:peptidyl-dipeptidase Dcp